MNRDRCTACNDSAAPRLLHNVRHRGVFHRLCTPCVLKFHPASFCPSCFEAFDSSPPSDAIRCSKCTSSSHSACVPSEPVDSSYLCASCSNPSSNAFEIGVSRSGDGGSTSGQLSIDMKSAKLLLAAARIAVVSMDRAVVVTRIEVERKVKEAAVWRKRAREALERAALIASKEKEKRLKGLSVPVPVPVPVPVVEPKRKSKGNTAVAAALAAQKRIQNSKPGGFSPSPILNSVGSIDRGKLGGLQTPVVVHRPPKNGIALDKKDILKGSPPLAPGFQQIPNHALQEEKVKNQTPLGPSVSGQQHLQSGHATTGEEGKLRRFPNLEMGPSQLPQSNQDASVSKANSGVIFTGSPSTTSLIS